MTSRISRYTFWIALVPLVLTVQGCDSGGTSAEINNEFSLTIEPVSSSGTAAKAASQATVSGYSFFYAAEHPDTGERVFGVYLSDDESFTQQSSSQGLFGVLARASGQPDTGSYEFASGETLRASQFIGFLYRDIANFQEEPFYVIHEGSLDVEESTESRISGSVDATATAYSFTDSGTTQDTVSVTGTFTAKDVETFVPLSGPGR